MKTLESKLLVELGWFDYQYDGVLANHAEWQAAKALVNPETNPSNLILAIHFLDIDMMQGVSSYSNAAANTDRVKFANGNYQKAVREEKAALENMLEENGTGKLRTMLVERIKDVGVELPSMPHVLKAFQFLAEKILTARAYRKSIARHRQGICGLAGGVEHAFSRMSAELKESGINKF